ncbi:Ig-like domain-containing protein [Evansella sp. AB-rgal1]|uniref:Ig-like domain-containing protein n=1 Tax=Evansella sp. AB-rgal1 TaxID=3242696 RepID=UPI00359E9C68
MKKKLSIIFLSILMFLSTMNLSVLAVVENLDQDQERVYIVNDDFEDKVPGTAVEDFPQSDNYSVLNAWNRDETIKSVPRVMEDPLGEHDNVIFVEDLGDSAVAVMKDIPRQTEPFTVELDFMAERFGHATKVMRLLDGSTVAAEIELRTIDGKNILGYSIPGGHEILVDDFQLNTWYNIRLLVDPENQQATPIINNVLKPTYNWRFLNATGVDRVLTMAPATPAISSYFDNLKVYEGIDDPLVNPDTPPGKVENVSISTDDLSIFLDWDAADAAASYTVKMATDPNGPFEPIVGATELVLRYARVDVVRDGMYYFVVESNNAKGSTISDVVSIYVEEYPDKIPAFPGAEGGGKFTSGGRGHDVYTVTTLEDYGPGEAPIEGSLRHALSGDNRTIVFAVSGNIFLKDELRARVKNVTIAGQTAPGDGITVAHHGLNISGSENVIIRYMRFRPGITYKDDEPDAIDGVDMKDIILDHVSTSWATDETLSIYRSENITVQWSIISESLTMSGHEKGRHGYGGIWGGKNATYHNNIIATHTSRNPRVGGSTPGQTSVDMNNNVIYNWGFFSIYGGNFSDVNIINNYMKPGPATKADLRRTIVNPGVFGSPSSWYVDGNYMHGAPDVTADNSKGVLKIAADATIRTEPIPFPVRRLMEPKPAEEAYHNVLQKAGATLPRRDAVDARVIYDIINGTGRFINDEYEVGGYPELQSLPAALDSDGDGIPDEWEIANGLDPFDPVDGKTITESGYSNLEIYLNSLVDMDHLADNPVAEIASPTLNSLHEVGQDIEIQGVASSANGIEKVEIFNGDVKIGETTTEPFHFTWENAPDGTHFISIKVTDKNGNQTQSTSAPIHVNSPLNSDVWTSTDVGDVGIQGSTSVDENDFITVKGAGRITGRNDSFHFAYQELKGDGEFVAKINSITPVDNNAISGIMIRNSLEPDAATAVLSTSVIKSDRIESRTPYSINLSSRLSDGQTIATLNEANYPDLTLPSLLSTDIPYWLKLTRNGNQISGYASPDGEDWTFVGSRTIALGEVVYVGMAVDAAKDSSNINNYNTAVFSDVSTTMLPPDGEVEPEVPVEYEVIYEDDFQGATPSTITTPEYRSLPDDPTTAMYLRRAGTITAEDDKFTVRGGRVTIGAREAVDTTEDFTPGGVFDLSKPYRMIINVADTELDPNNAGRRFQVFVDNGTSNDNFSIHGAESKIFQQTVSTIAPGKIIIESEVGTEESFIQLRTEGNSVIVIDSIRMEVLQEEEEPVVPAYIDVLPGSVPNPLNVRSNGVLPVAIVGVSDFDVADINMDTLRLEGVKPLRGAIEDVATPYTGGISNPPNRMDGTEDGPDGINDLVLKFSRQELVTAIGSVKNDDVVVVELTGQLKDGTEFVGYDVVWIRGNRK